MLGFIISRGVHKYCFYQENDCSEDTESLPADPKSDKGDTKELLCLATALF